MQLEHAIAANAKRAKHHDPSLAQKPTPKIALLTCTDPRVNELLQWLDIKPAHADVIRNVETAATDFGMANMLLPEKFNAQTNLIDVERNLLA